MSESVSGSVWVTAEERKEGRKEGDDAANCCLHLTEAARPRREAAEEEYVLWLHNRTFCLYKTAPKFEPSVVKHQKLYCCKAYATESMDLSKATQTIFEISDFRKPLLGNALFCFNSLENGGHARACENFIEGEKFMAVRKLRNGCKREIHE